jgi:hypothetical protein
MTEAEWIARATPDGMFAVLHQAERVGDRKLRLYAIACARRCLSSLVQQDHATASAALKVAERFADGDAEVSALWAVGRSISDIESKWNEQAEGDIESVSTADIFFHAARCVGQAVSADVYDMPYSYRISQVEGHALNSAGFAEARSRAGEESGAQCWRRAADGERKAFADLIRDIFGNPFRPVTFDPAWRTSTAVATARSMYDSRDFSRMPLLADALQDAGCEQPDILEHCRCATQHVRGCWVVDLVLGRE